MPNSLSPVLVIVKILIVVGRYFIMASSHALAASDCSVKVDVGHFINNVPTVVVRGSSDRPDPINLSIADIGACGIHIQRRPPRLEYLGSVLAIWFNGSFALCA